MSRAIAFLATAASALAPTARRRTLLGGAAAAALAPRTARADDVVRSPRPLGWKILPGDPPLMQPYTERGVSGLLSEIGARDVVLLGCKRGDAADHALAADLALKLGRAAKKPVALGLDAAPLGADLRGGAWLDAAARWPSVNAAGGDASYLAPLAAAQAANGWDAAPLGVAAAAMGAVQRNGGIAALSETERNAYVDDVGAFVRYPQLTPGFDIYAERVVARTYQQRYGDDKEKPAYKDFFASFILYDEAVASSAARYVRAHPGTLLVCVVADDHVKFGYGAPGRLARLEVDPEGNEARRFAAASVLLNPTAASTASSTRNLRLSLAVNPPAARRCSDYVFFSSSPAPSLITHMMNPVDGNPFKGFDLGLSMPSV